MTNIKLRNWQSESIRKCLQWFTEKRDTKHFVINAAPGAGKTICAAVIATKLLEQKKIKRVIVIAPRNEVVKQWSAEFLSVSGRHMSKITGADNEVNNYGVDLCATWAAISNLEIEFRNVCDTEETLVICDEHHHAAVSAAWGDSAGSAFENAKFVLILTGTPIRSDRGETVWLTYNEQGKVNQPAEGMYTLDYGQAVELGYCRPVTFHRHEGDFTVSCDGTDGIKVSGSAEPIIPSALKNIRGLKQAVDFYKLACTPKYQNDEVTPDLSGYQATMIKHAIEELNEQRLAIPNAGGLVIAPNIEMAEYMAAIIEMLEKEKPTLVHSNLSNCEERIAAFRNTNKKWIVSVAMISEGVDIKRLRVLVYLPNARTELAFRQSIGRVVRTLGKNDRSRAYVIMPRLKILEEYAKKVEKEMGVNAQIISGKARKKVCPECEQECNLRDKECSFCGYTFPEHEQQKISCDNCGTQNPITAKNCKNCGDSFQMEFGISLKDAYRDGVISIGMTITEEEIKESENLDPSIEKDILSSGNEVLINMWGRIPKEAQARFINIVTTKNR